MMTMSVIIVHHVLINVKNVHLVEFVLHVPKTEVQSQTVLVMLDTLKNVEPKELLVMNHALDHTVHYVTKNVSHVPDLQLIVKLVLKTESQLQTVSAQVDTSMTETLSVLHVMENVPLVKLPQQIVENVQLEDTPHQIVIVMMELGIITEIVNHVDTNV